MIDVELPSGITISVNPPTFGDRLEAVKQYRPVREQVGYSLEELMAAKAIAAINGNPVVGGFAIDPIYHMMSWSNKDVQYYLEFYMASFFLEERMREKAVDEAKKLMMGLQMQNVQEAVPTSKTTRAKGNSPTTVAS